jgi:hypothetical protein
MLSVPPTASIISFGAAYSSRSSRPIPPCAIRCRGFIHVHIISGRGAPTRGRNEWPAEVPERERGPLNAANRAQIGKCSLESS